MSAPGSGSHAAPPPVSRATALKIVASVLLATVAVGSLLFASMRKGAEYYKHVDEVTANPGAWQGRRLQVHGHVVDGSIEQAKGTLDYRFRIESRAPRPKAVMSVVYSGVVPDTFRAGSEVVAKGTLRKDGTLEVSPDGIMAKCPSKYEASPTVSTR